MVILFIFHTASESAGHVAYSRDYVRYTEVHSSFLLDVAQGLILYMTFLDRVVRSYEEDASSRPCLRRSRES